LGPAVLARRLYVKLSLNGSGSENAIKYSTPCHKSFPGVVYKYKDPECTLGKTKPFPLN